MKKIDMSNPETQRAWEELLELAEYYQTRCHDAERALIDVCEPFKFFWFGGRYRVYMKHYNKWKDAVPKIFKYFMIDEQ